MLFDLDKAEEAIKAFNEDDETLAGDRLVWRHLGPGARESLTVAERVVLLDKVWDTQMAWNKPRHVRRVIDSIKANEGQIVSACQSLPADAIESATEQVKQVARHLLPIVMGHADGNTGGYTPYSFATKYLHWTTRRHFPIMDSRARKAICRLIDGKSGWPCIHSESPGPDDYPEWIDFFNQLIGSLEHRDRERLVAADFQSQPDGLRCENTLLRILDKVLYWWGDPEYGAKA